MNQVTQDIGQKLWNLCNLLRDDGVTYHQYVTELTFLLFLKMAKETGAEGKLPNKYRWASLEKIARDADLGGYKELLLKLGSDKNPLVQQIFANATTSIRKPKTLSELVKAIDELNWYSVDREQMGDLYEDLLERNASEKKSGAGQYFTPRPLIDCMVSVMKPCLKDVIQDPAAGTGGFLIAAWQFIKKANDNLENLKVEQVQRLRRNFHGMELVQDAHRLALMNLMLHGFEHVDGMHLGDTLTDEGSRLLPASDLILTNPPFGTKKGGGLPVSLNSLAELIQRYKTVRCVVINACDSLATLTKSIAPFTVGMQMSVTDQSAIEFARGFYDAIVRGKEVDFAVNEGKIAATLKGYESPAVTVLREDISVGNSIRTL